MTALADTSCLERKRRPASAYEENEVSRLRSRRHRRGWKDDAAAGFRQADGDTGSRRGPGCRSTTNGASGPSANTVAGDERASALPKRWLRGHHRVVSSVSSDLVFHGRQARVCASAHLTMRRPKRPALPQRAVGVDSRRAPCLAWPPSSRNRWRTARTLSPSQAGGSSHRAGPTCSRSLACWCRGSCDLARGEVY